MSSKTEPIAIGKPCFVYWFQNSTRYRSKPSVGKTTLCCSPCMGTASGPFARKQQIIFPIRKTGQTAHINNAFVTNCAACQVCDKSKKKNAHIQDFPPRN